MRFIILYFLLGTALLGGAEEETSWSKPVNGLRGRLLVLPPLPSDPAFCRVFIELQNTENVLGQRKVRFAPDKLAWQVIDKNGKPLAVSPNPYDGFSTEWEPLVLPFGGTIKFLINSHGLAYRKDTEKVIIDMGAMKSWVIPQTSDYFLSATLSIAKGEGATTPHFDWSGTLSFPKVEIPNAK